jgi:hypothetical protein
MDAAAEAGNNPDPAAAIARICFIVITSINENTPKKSKQVASRSRPSTPLKSSRLDTSHTIPTIESKIMAADIMASSIMSRLTPILAALLGDNLLP